MKSASTTAKVKKRRVTFSLDAPGAAAVGLAGEFNGWDPSAHPMKRDGEGRWRRQVLLPEGRFEYKFVVDHRWQTDPANDRYCPNGLGSLNSVLEVATK
jgi:1,4-alpha-glucan branching enzyme